MEYRSDIFGHQYVIVSDFIRHLAYFRALREVFSEKKTNSHFWGRTADSHLESAAIDWCKVFGSDWRNDTHWKKIVGKAPETAIDEFRKRIPAKTGLSQSEWAAYHKSMCDFRDKYVAHVEIGNIPKTPSFDVALKVVFAYDEWVRGLIEPDFISDPSLDWFYLKWFGEAKAIASLAVVHTESVLETA